MILLVIRHGESEADILKVHEGRADFELTARGHKQAEAMAEAVAKNYRVTKIYASTLKRAAQTAAHLSAKTGIGIVSEPDLMEFDNGLLAGLSFEEADRLYPEVTDLPVDRSVYGQETKAGFRSRAVRMLEKILTENGPESVVAVVTHGGMINQLYGALLHSPIGGDAFFKTSDTGIHVWNLTDRGSDILKANWDAHIRDL